MRRDLRIPWLHSVLSENHGAERGTVNRRGALRRGVLARRVHRLEGLCEGQDFSAKWDLVPNSMLFYSFSSKLKTLE